MLAKIFDNHPSLVYRCVVEKYEKLPQQQQQIDDSITEIDNIHTRYYLAKFIRYIKLVN